jgi:hypothetical protein
MKKVSTAEWKIVQAPPAHYHKYRAHSHTERPHTAATKRIQIYNNVELYTELIERETTDMEFHWY